MVACINQLIPTLEYLLSSHLLNISDYSYDFPAISFHSYTSYFYIPQPKKCQVSCFKLIYLLQLGNSLNYVFFSSHQGFKDNVYRKRRKYFADLAMNYKQ